MNTLSPMPMQMIDLPSNSSVSWTRTLTFSLPGYTDGVQPWVPPGWLFWVLTTFILATTTVGLQIKGYASKKMDRVGDFRPTILSPLTEPMVVSAVSHADASTQLKE